MTNGETIGIYGGTFDPPHAGHVQAAAAAMQALKLDRLLVVPAGIPPHKRLPRETASAAARLEMAGLAFASVEGVQLCDLELRREGKSYTVDTLRALRLPGDFCYGEQRVGTLSGGKKVKLQLCRLLMEKPQLLLLDEPSNDLDIETLE